jgi:signal transduction histidine kinase
MPDTLGFLWMSTNHGLFRVHQHEIDAYLAGRTTDIYYAYYGKGAGIGNTEFNGGCDPTYVRLANGYASFPTLDGLVWFKPEEISDPYPSAPVRLDAVLVDGNPVGDSSAISLRPDKHELIVRFSVSYWGEPANVQLVYQLPGVQDEWYPIGADQRELRFQHLPYGDHTLTVRKLGTPANGDRGDLVLHFTVRRPYYLSAWFFLLCGGGALGVYITTLRVNQLRLRRKNIALGRMVRQRTLELQSINQRLERSVTVKERLVSIISHDIVTPLRFIARVAHKVQDVSDQTPAQEIAGTLHDIALSSDKLYMNARNLLNWIKHQGGHIELRRMNVAMAALVDDTLGPVRELAATKGTELLNVVPTDDVVHTDRDVVGIILQNLVNNALNHGEGGRVIVSGEQRPDAYRLVVADDGPGLPERTANAIRLLQQGSGRRASEGSDVLGLGYVIITELLQLLGGELLIGDNAGRGSRITVVLPTTAGGNGSDQHGF